MPGKTRKASTPSIYGVHPGVAMVQKWMEDLPTKTGRSLEEWIQLVQKSGHRRRKSGESGSRRSTTSGQTPPGGLLSGLSAED